MIDKLQKQTSEFLVERGFIAEDQFQQISGYQKLEVFSLHTELRLLIYLSISLFCAGVGLFIANNIDQIGHTAVLSILFLAIGICYYFAFKNAPKFSWKQTSFENIIYEYVVLAAIILSGIFIGYLQFQFDAFGLNYSLATFLPTILVFATAYYFDNKSVLSIAITGLVASIGLSINAKSLIDGTIFDSSFLSISGVILAALLLTFAIYSERNHLKSHFSPIYYQFSVHLMGIIGIANLTENYWFLYFAVMAVFFYYIINISIKEHSLLLFIFAIIYSYIGAIIIFYKILDLLGVWKFIESLFILFPFFFAASIYAFILIIQKFRKNYGSL